MANRITAYHSIGTKDQRIVWTYTSEETDLRAAMNEANYYAARWNRDEERENMVVNFIENG